MLKENQERRKAQQKDNENCRDETAVTKIRMLFQLLFNRCCYLLI